MFNLLPQRFVDAFPVDRLAFWPGNNRIHDDASITESIDVIGFYGAVMVWDKEQSGGLYQVIVGNGRLKNARKMGAKNLPVFFLDCDEETATRIVMADNQTTLLGGYDIEKTTALLEQLMGTERGIAGTGWSAADYQEMLDAVGKSRKGGAANDDDGAISEGEQLKEKWQTDMGQVWQIGDHRLIIADSTDPTTWARLMNGMRAVWCWTDPPYGVDYVGKTKDALTLQGDGREEVPLDVLLREALGLACEHCEDGAPIYIAYADSNTTLFHAAMKDAGFKYHQTLIWVKNCMVMGHSDFHYKHEPILYGWKGTRSGKKPRWYGERVQTTILKFDVPADIIKGGKQNGSDIFEFDRPSASALHPTMKPVALVEYCLNMSSRIGDLGIDPFLGSGTTMLSAHSEGRICYGCEIDPVFGAVILERMLRAYEIEGRLIH